MNKKLTKRISLYIDGMLTGEQERETRELIGRSPDARAIHDALRANRDLLQNASRLEPAPFFWSRLSHRLEQESHRASEDAILPVPRKYLPALGALAVIAVGVAAILLFQQGGELNTYVAEQARMVKSFYDATLNTRLFPFLSDVSNDDVLTYAVTGTLPMRNSDQVLEIGNSPEKKYWVRMKPKSEAPGLSLAALSEAVPLDQTQKEHVSRVLDSYRSELEKSILLAQKDTIAIASRVWEMSNAIIYDIARGLDDVQRQEFEQWVTKTNPRMPAHFKNVNFTAAPAAYDRVFTVGEPHPFVFVTPETTCIQNFQLTPQQVSVSGGDLHIALEPLMEQNRRRALVFRKSAGADKKVRVLVHASGAPPAEPSLIEISAPDVEPEVLFGVELPRQEEMIRQIRMIRVPRMEHAVDQYTRAVSHEALRGAQEGLEQLRALYPEGRGALRNGKIPQLPGDPGRFIFQKIPEGINIQMLVDSALNIRFDEMKRSMETKMRRYDSLSRQWEHSQRQTNRVWQESIRNMSVSDSGIMIVTPDSQVIRINKRSRR